MIFQLGVFFGFPGGLLYYNSDNTSKKCEVKEDIFFVCVPTFYMKKRHSWFLYIVDSEALLFPLRYQGGMVEGVSLKDS